MKATKKELRIKRKRRVRAKISGTSARPRLSVYRTNTSLAVQLIDDGAGVTIASARVAGKNIAHATELGTKIAALARQKGITTVVFDRSGYQYHGKIAAVAEAARAGGLAF